MRRRLLAAAAIPKSSRGVAIGAEFEQERDHVGVARRRRDVQRRFLVMVRVIGEEEDDRDQREDEGEQHETLHGGSFGAGHGGLSHLMWSNNMNVINIEPSGLPNFYNNRWKTLHNIDQVETNSIDILYGSHSLEHVQNIENFKKEVKRILKSDGYLFWEVPNAEHTEGDKEYPDIVIPHTYYFKKSFFKLWFSKTLLCETYNHLHNYNLENYCNEINDNGKIIRAIGQL